MYTPFFIFQNHRKKSLPSIFVIFTYEAVLFMLSEAITICDDLSLFIP